MLIAGDGKAHIHKLNSLDPDDWVSNDVQQKRAIADLSSLLYNYSEYDKNKDNKENFRHFNFDVLLTNPPFAGEIHQQNIKARYEFAQNESGEISKVVERDLLFIERSLQFIKPGGRLAIVLPQGKLNNLKMENIRSSIREKARILAVVSLGKNTFKLPAPAKGTGTKTSILILQKWKEDEIPLENYHIFMAVSNQSGKNTSGEYIYKKDTAGLYLEDSEGKRIIDHDLDDIADEFIKFAKRERLHFGEAN